VSDLHEAVMESREEIAPWMPWCHSDYSIEDSRSWVEMQETAFAEGTEYAFVIASPEGRFLGGCGLNFLDRGNRRANLGYWLRKSATGHGFATEAVRQLVEWTYANTDLDRLEVVAAVENVRSLRVAELAGASREGVLRRRIVLHEKAHDAVVFSFVRR